MAKQILLIEPVNGAANQPVRPIFRWEIGMIDAPINLVATMVTPVSIAVSWTPISGAASYNLYLNDATEPVNIPATTYVFTDLYSAAHYKIEVAGLTSGSLEGPRARLDIDTAGAYGASEVTDSSVRLHWAAITNATEYRIYHSTSLLQAIDSNPGEPTITTTITGLLSATTYLMRIAAVVGGVEQLKMPGAGITVLTQANVVVKQSFSIIGPQSVIVPVLATKMEMKIWGAGGGGGAGSNSSVRSGGGGGYVSGEVDVTPGETLLVYVGEGGSPGQQTQLCGAGGGLSGVFRGATPLAIAGSGGGGASWSAWNTNDGFPGGAGGGLIGGNGGGVDVCGKGGTQTAGGVGGSYPGTQLPIANIESGTLYQGGSNLINPINAGGALYGGTSGNAGAGGGAGYYGGGAGAHAVGLDAPWGGAGGGSSLVPENGLTFPGTGINPGNMNDPDRTGTIGIGGVFYAKGGNGLVVLTFKK